jgi:hypothetical protein
MLIYMTHPLHGATHVFAQDDVKRLEPFGWVVSKEPENAPSVPLNGGTIHVPQHGVVLGRRRK